MTTRIVVEPASGGREALAVLVMAALVLAGAAGAVALRRAPQATTALPAWQIDARDALTAAEQGLNADLLNAAAEIAYLAEGPVPPAPALLAGEALPPFAPDPTAAARGGHAWTLIADQGRHAYLGRPAAPEPAGALLLRLEPAPGAVTVWLNRDLSAAAAHLDDGALVAAGWRQVITRYDASVTRGTAE